MIKKKTYSVSNDGIQSTVDQKSLQCKVTLLDGEEMVQDFSVSVCVLLWAGRPFAGLLRAQEWPLTIYGAVIAFIGAGGRKYVCIWHCTCEYIYMPFSWLQGSGASRLLSGC